MITVEIDEITHCLVDTQTGKEVKTFVRQIKNPNILDGLTKESGWFVDWKKLLIKQQCEIYALYVENDDTIQGLVALKPIKEDIAVYVQWMVANPQNQKRIISEQKYIGIGGHLFAIAANISIRYGFDGYFYGDAANSKLVQHYVDKLKADSFAMYGHPYRIVVSEETVIWLKGEYSYDMVEEKV